ncbi:NACHT domain-containing protein [Streptomyces sp. NPDC005485]|uniref:NACHT domain-containing protein n=1 Tax=Streptomyces sp. NPDC005485 TaxID=3155591 RepID=UPI0033B5498A
MGERVHDVLLAASGVVLTILVLKFKDVFKRLVDLAGTALYNRLAGSALLARTALRRYTVRMYERHHRFAVSFRPGEAEAMDMASVYVPLRAASGFGAAAEQGEAGATLAEVRRAVVLGVPGAGKTMLLRHTVLAWARRRYDPGASPWRTWYDPRLRHRVELGTPTDIPVLLPLHSVDLAQGDLVRHIVGHFAEHGFPKADKWVARALDEGRLALYFDGLDEVPTAQRPEVAAAIGKFMTVYGRCRAVVTCRVAVYRGEFNEEADRTLRVEEFDDRLVDRFLRGWTWPPSLEPDTVDQLLGALRDTPQLMTLARNPLLLTMIATLYSHEYAGTGQALPHNRTDFYEQVTVSLLRDRQRDAHFAQPMKRSALQQLALAAQGVPPDAYDRLAIPYDKVLPVMRETLERYGRPADDAEAMLNEIVDRSGLLLSVDNGERFQFAHLTLQEYLAATALADEPAAIRERYLRDPEVWRETVRLWCGVVSRDCTDVVREILAADPLLAFQCLADAQVVEDGLADELVTMFHDRLGGGGIVGADEDAVVAAFGLVAADRRPRGLAVFELLRETAEGSDDPGRARAATYALAATHLPRAARFLASRLLQLPVAKEALASMGDVAVAAVLAPEPDLPGELITEMLWAVRTPRAIHSLAELLRSDDPATAQDAAFRLADLVRDRGLVAVKRNVSRELDWVLRYRPGWSEFFWVMGPYREGGDWAGPRGIFIALAAHLRKAAESGAAPPPGVEPDPRLVVPLALVDYGGAGPRELSLGNELVDTTLYADLDAFFGGAGGWARSLSQGRHGLAELGVHLTAFNPSDETGAELGRRLVAAAGLSEARVRLLGWLRPDLCLRAVRLLTTTGIARNESWRSGTTRLRESEFAVRFSALLVLYVMLSIAPCARAGAVVLGGWSWGVQGWLGVLFLALNVGCLMYFGLVGTRPRFRHPIGRDRQAWAREHLDQAARRDIWTVTVCLVPLGSCIALAEWWGTWASGALGVALCAGVIVLLAPLATPRVLEKFLDEGLPSRVLPLVQE